MARLSLSFQTIDCSGRTMRIMVERRAIPRRVVVEEPIVASEAPRAAGSGARPSIAAEVREALARGPICFPRKWWFDA